MDRDEPHHRQCRSLIETQVEAPLIPSPVLVEVDHLLYSRNGPDAALISLFEDIRAGVYRVENLQVADYVRVSELLSQYSDFNVGFVDASVLSIVERLGEVSLATLDRRHFSVLRPKHVAALRLLPEI